MDEQAGILVKKTIIIHRPKRFFEVRDCATTIICGSQRGNTSVVAYSLYNMGFFLGEHIGSKNYEDQDILNLLPDPRLKHTFDYTNFSRFVQERNGQYARWGFKLPHASGYVEELAPLLRNPVFVICFRNPASVLRSISHRETKKISIEKMLRIAGRPLSAAMNVVHKTKMPAILIDTDEALRKPQKFVEEIANALQLKADPAIAEDLSLRGYKSSQACEGVSFIEQITKDFS